MTRHIRRVHRVPAIGRDPFGWLDAALDVAGRQHADLLLPVQEQVAVMSLARDRMEAAGLQTAVPDFSALAQVQDKVSAYRTLSRLGVPQPAAVVAVTAAELGAAGELGVRERRGVFVKTPSGSTSAYSLTPGAWRQLTAACREPDQATTVPAGDRGDLGQAPRPVRHK